MQGRPSPVVTEAPTPEMDPEMEDDVIPGLGAIDEGQEDQDPILRAVTPAPPKNYSTEEAANCGTPEEEKDMSPPAEDQTIVAKESGKTTKPSEAASVDEKESALANVEQADKEATPIEKESAVVDAKEKAEPVESTLVNGTDTSPQKAEEEVAKETIKAKEALPAKEVKEATAEDQKESVPSNTEEPAPAETKAATNKTETSSEEAPAKEASPEPAKESPPAPAEEKSPGKVEEEPIGAVEDLKAEVNALLSTPAEQDAEDKKIIEEAKEKIDETEAKEPEEGAVIDIQVIEEKKDNDADVLDIVKAAEEAFVAEVIPDNLEVEITPEEGEEVIEYTLNSADAIPIGAIAVATFAIFLALIFFYN